MVYVYGGGRENIIKNERRHLMATNQMAAFFYMFLVLINHECRAFTFTRRQMLICPDVFDSTQVNELLFGVKDFKNSVKWVVLSGVCVSCCRGRLLSFFTGCGSAGI